MFIFTARCYAERGIATASRLSVLTLRCRGHIGWNSSKNISRLISLESVHSLQTPISQIYSKGNTPKFWLE